MKNLKPLQLIFGGSATVSLAALIILLIVSSDILSLLEIVLTSVSIGVVCGITFHFLIRSYITEKLKILYRSIRKGKFDNTEALSINAANDAIEEAEQETKRWTEARMKEISKLKEQEEFRKEFLGNLAHELKTPIFAIQGYILTLLEGGLEDESINRKFLERASKATDRMTSILEDLDQLTKLEVNEIQLDLKNFDIHDLVQDIFEDLERKANKKKIKLGFARDYGPVIVNADKNKIGQVITNLISNSISYGNEGGETIVRFYIMDDIITIEVSDNGPGIEESHIPRLFERFYRVEKSRNRNEGGSGLGLAIAKHIIEAHGQTISVRSTPNVGSTFTFSLDKGKGGRV